MPYCPSCGKTFKQGQQFCINCGETLDSYEYAGDEAGYYGEAILEQHLEKKLAIKNTFKMFLQSLLFTIGFGAFFLTEFTGIILYFADSSDALSLITWSITIIGIIELIIIPASYFYNSIFIKNYLLKVYPTQITIHSGVLTKKMTNITLNRVQNVNFIRGVFDRMFDLYTIHIETAATPGRLKYSSRRRYKPEGYIPGLKDRKIFYKIKELFLESV